MFKLIVRNYKVNLKMKNKKKSISNFEIKELHLMKICKMINILEDNQV
jgi:hypothetical protein